MALEWLAPTEKPVLNDSEVHLWKISLPLGENFRGKISVWLHPDEKKRADRFHFQKDREAFSQFRGFLRYLLGQYLQKNPQEISLGENPQGKPALTTGQGVLYFNLAHSREAGLFAFTKAGEIGVDVEAVQDPYDGEKLAGRYFSPQESVYLNSVPETEKAKTFFRLWTLKEAYLKALGLGFSGGLDTFSVQPEEGTGAARLLGGLQGDRQESWLLKYFEVNGKFIGALAAPGKVLSIKYFDGNLLK